MSGLDIPGIGSGLDIKVMVKAIADSEMAPKEEAIKRQESRAEKELSALGKLFGAGGEFLNSSQNLLHHKIDPIAESSQPDHVDVFATGMPVERSHVVEVVQLASPVEIASNYMTAGQRYSGDLSLTYTDTGTGTAQTLTWTVQVSAAPSDEKSLLQVAESIELETFEKLQARVETGASGERLVIAPRQSGANIAVTVAGTGGFTALADSFSVSEAGQDCIYRVNGTSHTSRNHLIQDVIEGLELNLLKAEVGRRILLSVTYNIEALAAKISAFSDSCNVFMKAAHAAAQGDVKEGQPGSPTVRNLFQKLDRILGQVNRADSPHYRSLAEIGLTRMRDGFFSLDRIKLNRSFQNHPEDIPPLLFGRQSPVAKVSEFIRAMDKPSNGLQIRGATLERNIRKLSSEHVSLDIERQKITDRLLRKYVDMDQRVGQLKQVGSSLELMSNRLVGNSSGRGRSR
ncbi:flagellar filament capping protein FliD [Parendozoicomonas sp. Alg238-R29]|uniref:flagellar filament capping protein FliD n=1 Tax=Parendozoicomonas sp. Alg238-R29 TaxID=2993446 RepID=UPI00248D44C4|nr:flagellar filament capping protein FliD [Parendozoicomonas sp. Alg238-R29]